MALIFFLMRNKMRKWKHITYWHEICHFFGRFLLPISYRHSSTTSLWSSNQQQLFIVDYSIITMMNQQAPNNNNSSEHGGRLALRVSYIVSVPSPRGNVKLRHLSVMFWFRINHLTTTLICDLYSIGCLKPTCRWQWCRKGRWKAQRS